MVTEKSCAVQGGVNTPQAPGLSPGMIASLEEDERRKLVDKLDKKIKCGLLLFNTPTRSHQGCSIPVLLSRHVTSAHIAALCRSYASPLSSYSPPFMQLQAVCWP